MARTANTTFVEMTQNTEIKEVAASGSREPKIGSKPRDKERKVYEVVLR
jgi:hypothetical protein